QQTVDLRLKVDLDLFSRGGQAVLDAIEKQGYNTLQRRPAIGKLQKTSLLAPPAGSSTLSAIVAGKHQQESHGVSARHDNASSVSRLSSGATEVSYDECRRVAREAASNFYYAFFMLPRPKRDALCALYAFMRLVDDVSDSEETDRDAAQELTA